MLSTERAEAGTPYRVRASPRKGEERRRLTDEESHCRQEIDHIHGNPLGFSGRMIEQPCQLAAFE